jgi:hypothetical protein
VLDDLPQAASIADDNRNSGSHRFKGHNPKRFIKTWINSDIGDGVETIPVFI